MSIQHNTSGIFALLLSLDYTFRWMQVFEICLSTFYTTDTPSFLPVTATDLQSIMISQQEQDIFFVLTFQEVRFSYLSSLITVSIVNFFFGLSLYLTDNRVLQRPITGS